MMTSSTQSVVVRLADQHAHDIRFEMARSNRRLRRLGIIMDDIAKGREAAAIAMLSTADDVTVRAVAIALIQERCRPC